MNITINLAALIDALLLVSLIGGCTLITVLEYRKRKLLRKLRAQWKVFSTPVRAHIRSEVFFGEPLKKHEELYPKDVKTVITLIEAGEAQSALAFHKDGLAGITTWSEGPGLDVTRLLVRGITEMDQAIPGLIPVLQVMLDEERDKMKNHVN